MGLSNAARFQLASGGTDGSTTVNFGESEKGGFGVTQSCRMHAADVCVLTDGGKVQRRRSAWNVREREVASAQ